MRLRNPILFLLILASSIASAAQAPDTLAAGGWEFGGSLKFSHVPGYPIFDDEVPDQYKDEYEQFTDISLSVGRFMAEGFSLALRPSALFHSRRYFNSSLQESKRHVLFLGLGLEPSWYLRLSPSWMLGLGGEAGFGIWPGLPGIDDDVKESNKSFEFQLWLEPKVRIYFLASELLAPYAEIGYRLAVQRRTRDSNGDPYDPGVPLLEEVRGRFLFSLGLKYFLPQGARLAETRKSPYNDFMDIIIDG